MVFYVVYLPYLLAVLCILSRAVSGVVRNVSIAQGQSTDRLVFSHFIVSILRKNFFNAKEF
jgi:hypothetical protein